ncbi:carboxymuconolactone decarboxylase family protein [Pseudomonas sp. NFX98]|uniref:carboxymuconolactone decarboxylase family protein n=1 Tax=Pseudomonas sp. NFX98 TaxID=3399122 RepID=UPI0039FC132D
MNSYLSNEETLKRRKETRDAVLGPSKYSVGTDVISAPLLEWSDSAVWDVWSHEDLSVKNRCLVTITVLAIQGRLEQLELHIRGALNNGWTVTELAQWVNHVAVYGGVAAGAGAMGIAQKVAKELETKSLS